MDIQDLIIHKKTLSSRKARFSEFPPALAPDLEDCLRKNGIQRLYSHQAEMFEAALRGENAVITTSTASGNTLSFLLPVLQAILEDPLSRAIRTTWWTGRVNAPRKRNRLTSGS